MLTFIFTKGHDGFVLYVLCVLRHNNTQTTNTTTVYHTFEDNKSYLRHLRHKGHNGFVLYVLCVLRRPKWLAQHEIKLK